MEEKLRFAIRAGSRTVGASIHQRVIGAGIAGRDRTRKGGLRVALFRLLTPGRTILRGCFKAIASTIAATIIGCIKGAFAKRGSRTPFKQ
ncbi:hypothetical protein NKH98_14920 [Mesorhizobium sp. M0833]|uniref:hypothetical protein n=1 Tax=Mesorhizobium sp. M0833 TaxID=2957009 RepID=UPI003336D855